MQHSLTAPMYVRGLQQIGFKRIGRCPCLVSSAVQATALLTYCMYGLGYDVGSILSGSSLVWTGECTPFHAQWNSGSGPGNETICTPKPFTPLAPPLTTPTTLPVAAYQDQVLWREVSGSPLLSDREPHPSRGQTLLSASTHRQTDRQTQRGASRHRHAPLSYTVVYVQWR